MNHPKISIVTPSYNQGEFLEETIESVLGQGYSNLEYLILDGGSTDNSVEIIKKYEDHLTYWRSHPDSGQAAALREGFEIATGQLLNWVNSDDRLAPDALASVAEAFSQHGPDVVIAGGCLVFDHGSPGRVHWPRFQTNFEQPQPIPLPLILDIEGHWLGGAFFYQPEVFIPRTSYAVAGEIRSHLHITMDYDLWVRLALNGSRIVVIENVLAEYREHPAQKTADYSRVIRDLVSTANEYLSDERSGLIRTQRQLLKVSNLLAANRTTRRGLRTIRRVLNV